MTRSLVAFIFVILVIVIIFLMFQINDNSLKCREAKISDQERISKASKLLVQSTTQDHPLLSFEAAIEAKLIIEDVLLKHGGISTAEKTLKLPKGRLETLRGKIHDQYGVTIERYPELNLMTQPRQFVEPPIDDTHGKSRHHKSKSRHRHK